MSIIERAIDKLASQGGPKKKRPPIDKDISSDVSHELDKNNSEQRSASQVADSLANAAEKKQPEIYPELDDALTQHYESSPVVTQKQKDEKAEIQASVKRQKIEQAATEHEPDIHIKKLSLEGVLSAEGGRSRLAEEYRLIKRPLLVNAFAGKTTSSKTAESLHKNVIMLTSSVAGEGKTFTSLNLAISIAMEMDQTVLLIDSDLAKPGLSKLLNIRGEKGLTDYLSGEVKNIGDVFKRTDIPKLTVVGAGSSHSRSTELLASRAMAKLLDELAQRYPDRIVIFDSPPLLATTESVVLARQMGQICLVVESASTPQYMVKQALNQLHSTDSVSLILNKVKPDLLSTGYGYGYGYGQGYGEKS